MFFSLGFSYEATRKSSIAQCIYFVLWNLPELAIEYTDRISSGRVSPTNTTRESKPNQHQENMTLKNLMMRPQ